MNQTNLTIIGTGLAITTIIVSTIAVVAGGINNHLATITGQMDVMNGQINELRNEMNGRFDTTDSRIDELRNDMREDHREFNTRLRNVEIEFGKVEQRLETLERAVLPQAPAAP
jgi:chromosome segregation ATPase